MVLHDKVTNRVLVVWLYTQAKQHRSVIAGVSLYHGLVVSCKLWPSESCSYLIELIDGPAQLTLRLPLLQGFCRHVDVAAG